MKLTILEYITPSRLAGAERYFVRLVSSLHAAGHRVIVVTKRDTPLRAELESLVPDVELHAWHTHGKIDPPTLAKLCRLIRQENVDLINTHLTTASWQGSMAGRLTGVPVVAVVHATDRKTFFQFADRMIAVSGGVEDSLLAQGVAKEKIRRLYFGIDFERDHPVAPLPPHEAKTRLGLPPDARTVGVAASLIYRKGHRFLLDALKSVEAQVGPVHALFAGEGDQEAALREQAAILGRTERTHFLGFRRDVLDVVSAMDVFVLPSLKEGLSIAVMEAMALERPVVATRIAGMPEVVRHEETGLLVPPSNVGALGEALSRLLGDPAFARQLAVQSKTFLRQNFDQRRCLSEIDSFFQEVVADWRQNYVAPPVALPLPDVGLPDAAPDAAPVQAKTPSAIPTRRKLTILEYITPSRIGGAERYFVRLVSSLQAAGHRVIVVTKRDTPLRAESEALLPDVELHAWHTHGKIDPPTLAKLCRLIRQEKVDLINTHLTTASWQGSLAARLTSVPVVARVPATDRPKFYQLADYIIAVSNGVRDHLIAEDVAPDKIQLLYNGIDLHSYAAPLPPHEAKARLGLPPDAPTVGVAASLTFRKGHRFLLEALQQIEPQTGPVHALFAGEGDQEAPLRLQAAKLGVTERTHFLGFRRDMLEVLSAMDVVVLPSLKEGLSNAIMEAMALERPVVATNIAGMPEVVRHEETGLMVPPADVPALAGALSRLLGDEELARRLGRQGRTFLEQHFDQARCLNEVEAFFQRVVAVSHGELETPIDNEAVLKGAIERGAGALQGHGSKAPDTHSRNGGTSRSGGTSRHGEVPLSKADFKRVNDLDE